MAFETVSRLATERFTQVQNLVLHIAASERPAGATEPEAQIVHTLRGLFFVHLYGAWEYSVTRALIQLYSSINAFNVQHCHLEHIPGSIGLDAMFRSLGDVGLVRQWERRLDLLRKQVGTDTVKIDDGIFMFDVQFLKVKVLERIFAALDLQISPVPHLAYRGMIDELAERRAAVAHGRESPADVGSQFRSDELQRRYDAVTGTFFHIVGHFEQFVANRLFVRAADRHLYP